MGGLPKGRPTLICGGAGCGKTLFGIEFLVHGIQKFGEPAVCMSFEETAADLAMNVASLGFDLNQLQKTRKLVIDYVYIDRNEIAETGEYDLEGLFVRLNSAIDSNGAKRVLLDTPETLFAGLSNTGVLRSELRRLFRWLKDKGVTAIITAERGGGTLTRHGLEEYVSDCVILLDHRLENDAVTRRLRVLKYRGSSHGTGEYPFLVDQNGISVLPITSIGLNHEASNQKISTGIAKLDEMLGGEGYYRGSTVLLTGTAGTGKTSLGAHFVEAACQRGERAIFFAFEESLQQIIRNMMSIGIDLGRWVKKGLLHVEAARPSSLGFEMHLVRMHRLLNEYNPQVAFIDPISGFLGGGSQHDVTSLTLRIVDVMRQRGITAVFTAISEEDNAHYSSVSISSLVDTWILLRNMEANGERNRLLYVLKSRGMAHSNQVREFMLTSRGVRLREIYLGPGGVLTGSARVAREAEERRTDVRLQEEGRRREVAMKANLASVQAKIAALEAEKEFQEKELAAILKENAERHEGIVSEREELKRSRGAIDRGFATESRPNGRARRL